MDEEQPAWFVGVDWASQTHHAVIVDARGRKVVERGFPHGGEGLAELADWIGRHSGAPPGHVPVAIEVPHGPVVESLMERGFPVHAINPKQLDRFSPAGAKDDSRDAEVLASALRTDPRCFRRLEPLDPVIVALREWPRIAEDLRHDRNRLGNRVRELLWRYYRRCWNSPTTSRRPGSWNSGILCRPRRKPPGSARRRWIDCSSATGSAALMPPRC
jgi:transposase